MNRLKRRWHRLLLCAACILTVAEVSAQEGAQGYPIAPVPFTNVQITDRFWSRRLEVNREVSLPHVLRQCEETGRIRNFEVADSVLSGIDVQGGFCTRYGFDDSDVFKTIEGAAYILHSDYDATLDLYLDSLIEKIAAAQEKDGYLYTMRTIDPKASWAEERWVNARPKHSHELYNVGHLFEAAVAHYNATGKRTLLQVALRNADLLVETFGKGKMRTVPGHQETETGLVRLYLLTGRAEYLELARFFIEERGRGVPEGGTYNQDHVPVVEQTEAVGHAVRAAYMYAAMADIGAVTRDNRYNPVLDRIWDDVVSGKLYLTGGIGSAGNIEGFGEPYDLPNLTAYCETCASIAMMFWNHRMFLRHGDAGYVDVMERGLYNGFLSGVSMSGDRFFYVNPLESYSGTGRAPWFTCACCPPNIVRFLPRLGGYVYATEEDDLYVNLFVGSTASMMVGRVKVNIRQTSHYPWVGTISITIDPAEATEFGLRVRVPGWARGVPVPGDLYHYPVQEAGDVTLKVNGETHPYETEAGFAVVRRSWRSGDRVELDLPMPVRRVVADRQVEADRDRVAFERGPIVFCLEGADNVGGAVWNLVVPDSATLRSEYRRELLQGVQVVRGSGFSVRRTIEQTVVIDGPREFTAVPYFAWAHRGSHQMAVWAAREVSAARPLPAPTIAFRSTVTASGGKHWEAITDQLLPHRRLDNTVPYFHWWPKKGTLEWVQFDFPEAMSVTETAIHWFEDVNAGGCRIPKEWRLMYREGAEWRPVEGEFSRGGAGVPVSTLKFGPVITDGLRLDVQLEEGFSAGIVEWTAE